MLKRSDKKWRFIETLFNSNVSYIAFAKINEMLKKLLIKLEKCEQIVKFL